MSLILEERKGTKKTHISSDRTDSPIAAIAAAIPALEPMLKGE